ncbi:MAG: Asp-tRNA(Asn)/Glu-tRNA(Gln) amidotransferase subunit GatB [Gammaproteobacteria bacterium]
MTWETVVGLEIHAQLSTESKIFSPAAAGYCAEPNRQVREVDCGMPGALPSFNRKAAEYAIRLGLALEAEICRVSEFARKNYFYPDLPKGYQISQFEYPIVRGGRISFLLDGEEKTVGITRAHLEEDAGKLMHGLGGGAGVDLNRAGAPLLEIVSEPDIRSAREAAEYAKAMHLLVRWLGVCDGNMQEGSFRMDANISLRRKGAPLGIRSEIKNINSFRFLEQALEYEVLRQRGILEEGGEVAQETRLFDSAKGQTRAMRGKEDAHDYRYFPDPDLPPLVISEEWIEQTRAALPELPQARRRRFVGEFGLSLYDAAVLTASRAAADYFEQTLAAMPRAENASAKLCANWICGEIAALLNKNNLPAEDAKIPPEKLAGLLRRIEDGGVSGGAAKQVLEIMWNEGGEADAIIAREGMAQISAPAALEKIAAAAVAAHPKQAEQFRAGKEKIFGFFVGKVMQETKGRANPAQTNEILRRLLSGE